MALLQNPNHRESVFASVFPISSVVHTTPTPGATPEVGIPTPTQPCDTVGNTTVGNSAISNINASFINSFPEQHQKIQAQEDIDQIAAQIVKRDAAWSLATRFLTFPRDKAQRTPHVYEALANLLTASGEKNRGNEFSSKREHGKEHDIVSCHVPSSLEFGKLVVTVLMSVFAID